MASDPNANDYKYPMYILSLVDEWGSGYALLVQGYASPADDNRMRDLVGALSSQGRVAWANCLRIDRSDEESSPFEQVPITPA